MNLTDPAAAPLSVVLCTVFVLGMPLATAGLVLINGGFSRTSAVANAFFAPLLAMSIAIFAYFAVGFAFEGAPGLPSHSLSVAGRSWNWLGAGPFFLARFNFDSPYTALTSLFGVFSVGMCAGIPLFAGSERWRLGPSLALSALLGAVVFPLFAHWTWGGGWLTQLGSSLHPAGRGFVDVAGSGCVHAVGGLTALCAAWVLGPRKGKYNSRGMPTATPGHNAPFILFGCFLALQGWLATNLAGAFLHGAIDVTGIVPVAFNTVLCGVGGVISSAFITRVRFRKPDASLCANGWISGLVASSAGCTLLRPPEAMLVGLIAGTAIVFSVEILELYLHVDDPGGAVSVHAVAGLWGLLAAGLFSGPVQLAAQLAGVATLLGFVFPLVYCLNTGLNRLLHYRFPPESERQGSDLSELGAGAYPEFVIHRDDSIVR